MRIAITPEIQEVAIARYHETRSDLDGSDEELIVSITAVQDLVVVRTILPTSPLRAARAHRTGAP